MKLESKREGATHGLRSAAQDKHHRAALVCLFGTLTQYPHHTIPIIFSPPPHGEVESESESESSGRSQLTQISPSRYSKDKMSQFPASLNLKEDDVHKLLAAQAHIGTRNLDVSMAPYVWKRRGDGMLNFSAFLFLFNRPSSPLLSLTHSLSLSLP